MTDGHASARHKAPRKHFWTRRKPPAHRSVGHGGVVRPAGEHAVAPSPPQIWDPPSPSPVSSSARRLDPESEPPGARIPLTAEEAFGPSPEPGYLAEAPLAGVDAVPITPEEAFGAAPALPSQPTPRPPYPPSAPMRPPPGELLRAARPPAAPPPPVVRSPDPPVARDSASRDLVAAAAVVAEPAHRRSEARFGRFHRVRKLLAAALAAILIAVAFVILGGPDDTTTNTSEGTSLGTLAPASTTLVVGATDGGDPVWMTLASVDPASAKGAIVSVPAHTAVEVPGRGLQSLAEAYVEGGKPLLRVSLESLLGVDLDGVMVLPESGARAMLGTTGPLTVDVPAEVKVPAGSNTAEILFRAGTQELSPAQQVEYLYTVGLGDDDLDLGARQLVFWDALVRASETDGAALAEALAIGTGEPARALPGTGAASVFLDLAALPAGDRAIAPLPVSQISAGGAQLFSTREDELSEFVDLNLHASGADVASRIQVLNGNGRPGIGGEVAQLLVGHGFRVVLGGNARRLDYPRTLIISYDDSPEALEIADRAKSLLGMGEVQVSSQQQGIVDLTIVVGKDFLRKH